MTIELVLSFYSHLNYSNFIQLLFYLNHLWETDIRLENSSLKSYLLTKTSYIFKVYFVDFGVSFKQDNNWLHILLLFHEYNSLLINKLYFILLFIGIERTIGQHPGFLISLSLKLRQNHWLFLPLQLLLLSKPPMTSTELNITNHSWLSFYVNQKNTCLRKSLPLYST